MGAWEYADLFAIGIRREGGEKKVVIFSTIKNDDPDPDTAASTFWGVEVILDALNTVGALGWEVVERREVKRKRRSGFDDLVARLQPFSDGSYSVEFVTTYLLKRAQDPDNAARVLRKS